MKLFLHWDDSKPNNKVHLSENGRICLCGRKIHPAKPFRKKEDPSIKIGWYYCCFCVREFERIKARETIKAVKAGLLEIKKVMQG